MPVKSSPSRILLKGQYGRVEWFAASVAITPGMLVKLHNDSGTVKVKPHDEDGEIAMALFALEDGEQGGAIADAYAIGAQVPVYFAAKGDKIYAWLEATANVTIDHDELESGGDGALQAVSAQTEPAVGIPAEDLDLSATGAVDTRITIWVL